MKDWIEGAPPGKLRLLLVDDQALCRNGLSRVLSLEPDMDVVEEAESVAEALSIIYRHRVDVVLLNVELPGQAVLDFLYGLPHENRPKVVGLTGGMNGYQAHKLLRAGIDGLHLRKEPLPLLCDLIRRLGDGKGVLDGAWLRELLDRQQILVRPLTPRECEVLRGVARGLTSKEIAYELNSTEAAVKSVIQQLFEKTGVRSRAQLVRLAMERFAGILEESRRLSQAAER